MVTTHPPPIALLPACGEKVPEGRMRGGDFAQNVRPSPGPSPRKRGEGQQSTLQRGFSLIELLVVVTIIGILASIAMIQVRHMKRKALEAALKDNLFQMRKAIDNFYADKQRYPQDLNELVPDYIRKIPADPITQSEDWETVISEPENPDEAAADSANPEDALNAPGVIDIKSKAPGSTIEGTPYADL